MGVVGGGKVRSGRQFTLITPQRLSRFGIEVDEALRVRSSGFPGESDAGEEDADCFGVISQRSVKR